MRLRSLGSGSTGNASLIEAEDGQRTTRVLLDCGFSQRELAARLARAGTTVEQIDAIFVTHEHGDHVGCALGLSRRHRIPLWMSRGTWRAVRRISDSAAPLFEQQPAVAEEVPVRFARDGETITIGGLELTPYTVPHDAQEPLQVTFSNGDRRLGVLTDAGCLTGHILAHLRGCDALLLECNHDPAMLAASRYPPSLKARISGPLGHLSNRVAGEILAGVAHSGLRHVVAAHLSETNNTEALARTALGQALGVGGSEVRVADPKAGTDWITLR